MGNIFFISDHHFGHKQIIDYEARPFEDADEMTTLMIAKWNAVVGQDDTVFHLGDFSFLDLAKTKPIVSRLNGYKHLIMGNHDKGRTREWWLASGFHEVSSYPIIYRDFFLLSHEPMYINKQMPFANIHGHIHGQKYEGSQHINVSVEHWDYTPLSFEKLRSMVVQVEES